MKKELKKEELNKGNMVAKAPKVVQNPVKKTKRAIERTVYKAEQNAKKIGLKPLKPQMVQKVQRPLPVQPTPQQVKQTQNSEKEQVAKLEELEKLNKGKNQFQEPKMTIQSNPMVPIMDMQAQREYVTRLFGGMPLPAPFMRNAYYVDPMEINAAYNELLM